MLDGALQGAVGYGHAAGLAIEFKEDRPGAVGMGFPDCQQANHQRFARFDIDKQFLARLWSFEEGWRWQHRHVAIVRPVAGEVLEDPLVEQPRGDFARRGFAADDRGDLGGSFLHIGRGQARAGPAVDDGLVPDDAGNDLGWEATGWLAHAAREEIDHRFREGKFTGTAHQFASLHVVGHQEQGKVSDRLARWRHLDDVAKQLIDLGVGAADILPAVGEAEGPGLLEQVGKLTSGHFVQVEVGIGGLHPTLKRRVVFANC